MPSLPSDGVADQLRDLRQSVDGLSSRLGELIAENAELRRRLEHSETARADLLAQTEHIVELLADSRREIRGLRQKQGHGEAPQR